MNSSSDVRWTIVLCVVSAFALAAGILYVSVDSGTEARIRELESKLAQRDQTISELRKQLETTPAPAVSVRPVQPQADTQALLAEQLENISDVQDRIEVLLLQVQQRLTDAKLTPRTPERFEIERRASRKTIEHFRKNLADANEQVKKTAGELNVPDWVTKLDPEEAFRDPRYLLYQPYFGARKGVRILQQMLNAAMANASRIEAEAAMSLLEQEPNP